VHSNVSTHPVDGQATPPSIGFSSHGGVKQISESSTWHVSRWRDTVVRVFRSATATQASTQELLRVEFNSVGSCASESELK
jgi:hypothetical protein